MNELEICKRLDLKFEEMLSHFDSVNLRNEFKEKAYFAGGCIYCLRNDKVVKDYDLFLRDDVLIEKLKKLELWSFTSDYALTYGKFQIVTKYFGEPNFCVGQFDFKHNMHYYIPYTNKVMSACEDELLGEFEHLKYLETNELFFNENRARDIEGVWLRVKKFTDRGMTISKETKKKIKKRVTRKSINNYKKSTHRGNRKNYY